MPLAIASYAPDFRSALASNDLSSCQETQSEYNDRDYQQEVNQSTHCVPADKTEGP